MIYQIKLANNKQIEGAYKDGMKKFNAFFGFDWSFNKPNVCILKSRKEMDLLKGMKTERWLIAYAEGKTIFVLDNEKMQKESSHKKHTKEEYSSLIQHELCHLFYNVVSNDCINPIWLTEGVSIYLSGQVEQKKPVKKFSSFLEYYKNGGGKVYDESGTAVKLLVENFGKNKILKLISESRKVEDKKDFEKLFKKIYGFDLSYKKFNDLLDKKK